MNKVFRVIWNPSLGNWVAVPETAKACGKRGKSIRALSVAALLAAGATSVQAQNLVNACTGISLPPSVVTQILSPLANALDTIPLISSLVNLSGLTTSAPISVSALTTSGTVVDTSQPCISQNSGFSLTTPKGISLGGNMVSGLGGGVTANAGEINSIALGNNAQTSATALSSVAIGQNASVTGSATGAVVLGNGATSALANSVALGAGSTTAGASNISGNAALGVTTNAGAVTAGSGNVVSVGAPGAERQIQNVAAGAVSATSTDAVNGSQLAAVAALNSNAVQYDNAGKTSVTLAGPTSTDGGVTGGTTMTNLHQGRLTATSTDAINGAQLNQVATSTATNLGGGSTFNPATGTVTAPSYTIQGSNYNNVGSALTAVDGSLTTLNTDINGAGIKYFHANSTLQDSQALGTDSVAIGPNAVANNAGSVALGAGSTTAGASNISGNAALGVTTNAGAVATGSGSVVSVGAVGAERQIQNVAAGAVSATSTDAVNGSQLSAVATLASSAVQYDNAGKTSVTLAGPTSTDGGVTGGTTMTNLHQGRLTATSTDAINGAQLNQVATSTATNLGGGSTFNPATGTVTAPSYTIQGSNYNNVGNALTAVDGSLTTLNTDINGAGIKYFHANSTLPDSQALGTDSVAIGPNAVANNAGSVALGAGSTTAGASNISGNAALGVTTNAGAVATGSGSVVSVGAVGAERQIQNVAAGAVSATSTDAVNGSQLSAVATLASNAVQYDNAGKTSVTMAGPTSTDGGVTGGTTITNLHQGAVTATSTDAVDGAQLFAVSAVANNAVQYDNAGKTSATLAGPTSTDGGITGGTTITNLHQGAVTATSTDAVNGAQLYAVGAIAGNAVQYDNPGKTSATLAGPTSTDGGVTGGTTITNLHQGTVTATSTDAINGAQLDKVATTTATNLGGGSTFDPTTGTVTAPSYVVQGSTYNNVGGALSALNGDLTTLNTNINGAGIKYFHTNSTLPDSQALGTDSVAIGPNAVASNANSVSIGNGAQTTANNSVALGSGSQATRGAQTYVGPYSNVQNTSVGTVSVGAAGATRQITNVADGSQANDAVNLQQLNGAVAAVEQYTNTQITNVKSSPGGSTGGAFQVSADSTVAASATGSQSAAGGSGAVASGANTIALGSNANAPANNSVALGSGSVADRANTVSVGAAGAERQITNVAAGTANTDGVNVAQLNGATKGAVKYDSNPDGSVNNNSLTLNSGGSAAAIHNVANGVASGDAVNYGQLQGAIGQSNTYTDTQIAGVRNDINKVGKEAYSGAASAIAIGSLTQSISAGEGMASVAVGTYQGQSSLALGISKVSDNGRWIIKGGITTNTQGQFGAGAGAGFHF